MKKRIHCPKYQSNIYFKYEKTAFDEIIEHSGYISQVAKTLLEFYYRPNIRGHHFSTLQGLKKILGFPLGQIQNVEQRN